MPAPRACRSCGEALDPNLRWYGRCHAPVTEFAARPVAPGGFVDTPRHHVPHSRWKAGPLTFGPIGRIVPKGDNVARYAVVVIGVMSGAGLLLAWLAGI